MFDHMRAVVDIPYIDIFNCTVYVSCSIEVMGIFCSFATQGSWGCLPGGFSLDVNVLGLAKI